MRFHVMYDDIVIQKRWMKVGNPYDCEAGRRNAKAPFWACRSVGRSLPWHGRGPEFKSRHVHYQRHSALRERNMCINEIKSILFT